MLLLQPFHRDASRPALPSVLRTFTGRQDNVFYYRGYHHQTGDDRQPAIRCIIKELGCQSRPTSDLARKLFHDTKALHQLGVMGLDLKLEQVINDRMADFSTAVTFPHIISDPRLPEWGAKVSR